MRAKRARLALAFAVLVTPFLLLTPANAHATITSSSPPDGSRLAAAPALVSITFDEPVTLVYLHVVDAHGRRVDDGADTRNGATIGVGLRTGLGQGTFVESYRVISADSHPVAGSIRFVVGNGALDAGGVDLSTTNAWTSGLFVAVRWIGFAGLAVVGGAWLLITGWPQGRREPRARRLLWAGWGALSAAAAAELLLQGPYAAGEPPGHLLDWSLLQQTLHTPYGVWHSVRLILLGVLAVWLARLLADRAAAEDAFYALGLGVLLSYSATGHARTTDPAWLSISVDVLHLAAMATWVGGLALLLGAVLRRDPDERIAALTAFGRLAPVAVATLAVTGTYSAWRGIGAWAAVFGSTYGLLVLAKIVLFVALLAVAAFARRSVGRRNTEAVRRAVIVEITLALIVFVFTAFLVDEPRGRDALTVQYRKPVTATAPIDARHQLLVTVEPGVHGQVTVTVQLPPGTAVDTLTGTATLSSKQIGPLPIRFTRVTAGDYSAGDLDLPAAGTWTFTITLVRSQFDSVVTTSSIRIH